jgi:hypothetical protein
VVEAVRDAVAEVAVVWVPAIDRVFRVGSSCAGVPVWESVAVGVAGQACPIPSSSVCRSRAITCSWVRTPLP